MKATLLFLAAASLTLFDPFTYRLTMRGAVTLTAHGSAEVGPAGTTAEPYYTITLGGPDGEAAVVFTRAGSTPPTIGVYRVGESALAADGFSGLIITGMPAHPTGVFRVQSGTLIITDATPGGLKGRFELRARGFKTGAPDHEGRDITADGSFTARARGRDPGLTLNNGGTRL
jgi:hypothetical protein